MKQQYFITLVILSILFSCGNIKDNDLDNKRVDVDPDQWIEFNDIQLARIGGVEISNGFYKAGGDEWTKEPGSLSDGDLLSVRVKSSIYPNDVTMCEVRIGEDTIYFSAQTKMFDMPQTTDGIRNKHLGISGPDNPSLGGPAPRFSKYLANSSNMGSAVREGLIPDIKPLFDVQVRDAVICVGHDGRYYLTGSTGDDIWHFNDGVELWVSSDLVSWDYMGLVWNFEDDATWEKEWRFHHKAVRALWAPEILYIKGSYYITHSMPPGGRGLLKSSTGKPEGPYVNALANDGYWAEDIDGSLFEDEDGSVYYVYGGGWIAKMKDDMSGLAEEPVKPILLDPDLDPSLHARTCETRRNCEDIGHEGAFVFKRNGLYYLTAADSYQGRYSSVAAVSESIYGPYRMRHEAVPCSGGTSYFKDHEDRWWCTYFGNDNQSAFREMPAMIRVDFAADGRIFPAKEQPFLDAASQSQWNNNWDKNWRKLGSIKN